MRPSPRPVLQVLKAFATCLVLALPAAVPAWAQQDGFAQQLNDIRDATGIGRERAPLDFTERPPLVVPPTNTLPPPGSGDARLGVNDPDLDARSKALVDPRRPVPPSDPGAAASGLAARRYLVDPPSGLRDPATVAADIETDTGPAPRAGTAKRRAHKKRTPAPEAAAQ